VREDWNETALAAPVLKVPSILKLLPKLVSPLALNVDAIDACPTTLRVLDAVNARVTVKVLAAARWSTTFTVDP